MTKIDVKQMSQGQVDPIDDYLECVTYCSISSIAEENDCQTICMERHLKSSYFQIIKKIFGETSALAQIQLAFEILTKNGELNKRFYTVKIMLEKPIKNQVGLSMISMIIASFTINISMINK